MECLEKPIWNKYTKEELEQHFHPKTDGRGTEAGTS